MFIDRVVMIHVELHHRDDPAEVGNEAAEHAGLVHHAQDDFGLAAGRQQFEKDGIGFGVVADRLVDQRAAICAQPSAHRDGFQRHAGRPRRKGG